VAVQARGSVQIKDAVNERAPASTAQTASPKITANQCRTPRRCPWVSDPGQHSQQPRRIFRGIFGKVSEVADSRVNG
jgi:hypothetical protein